jgi:hypothetical protein
VWECYRHWRLLSCHSESVQSTAHVDNSVSWGPFYPLICAKSSALVPSCICHAFCAFFPYPLYFVVNVSGLCKAVLLSLFNPVTTQFYRCAFTRMQETCSPVAQCLLLVCFNCCPQFLQICHSHFIIGSGMAQVGSCQPVIVETWGWSQASPGRICGVQSDTRMFFFWALQFFTVSIIAPMQQSHLLICQ